MPWQAEIEIVLEYRVRLGRCVPLSSWLSNFNIILTTCERRCEKMVDILFHLRHGVKSKEVQGA